MKGHFRVSFHTIYTNYIYEVVWENIVVVFFFAQQIHYKREKKANKGQIRKKKKDSS